jgi:uncharacterized OB-fold protein
MAAEDGRADESLPFFEACGRGELVVQGCDTCGHRQFYPRRWCLVCDSTDLGWVPVSGHGELVTFSVVRRAPSAAHKDRVPYVIGIVKLHEGPQMMASIGDGEIDRLVPGMQVHLVPTVDTAPCFIPARLAAL